MNKDQGSREIFQGKLRQFRKERRFNQSELAKMVGVAPNSISNYENGVSMPDYDIIDKIVNALGVTPDQLFGAPPEVQVQGEEVPDSVMADLDELETRHPESIALVSRLKSGFMRRQDKQNRTDAKVIRLLEVRVAIYKELEKLGIKIEV